MATAGHGEPISEADLAALRRLPLGPRSKTGPWGLGCLLLGWALIVLVVSGFAAQPIAWTIGAALAAALLTAPHAWAWMRDGVAPAPQPPEVEALFAERLTLWFVAKVVVHWPTALGDLVVTPIWNLVGRRRAEATRLRRTAALQVREEPGAEELDRAAPRGARRDGRPRRAIHEPSVGTGRWPHDDEPGGGPLLGDEADTADLGRTDGVRRRTGPAPRGRRPAPGSGALAPAGREPRAPEAPGPDRHRARPDPLLEDPGEPTTDESPRADRVHHAAGEPYGGLAPDLREALGGGAQEPRRSGRVQRLARRLQLTPDDRR